MFRAGEFCLELVKTGKLTFEKDGTPTVSEMLRETVWSFHNEETPDEMQKKLKQVKPKDLIENTRYVRLFRVPAVSFDAEGRLEAPRFLTIGFYKTDSDDFRSVVNFAEFHGNVEKVCDALPATVTTLFGEPEED